MVTIEFNVDKNNVLQKKTFGAMIKGTKCEFKFNFESKQNFPKVCYMKSLLNETYEPLAHNSVIVPDIFDSASTLSINLFLRLPDGDLKTNTVMIEIE